MTANFSISGIIQKLKHSRTFTVCENIKPKMLQAPVSALYSPHNMLSLIMRSDFFSQYLEKELGLEALKTMKKIKVALDPNNIMNPGKLIPPHICF